MVGQMFSTPRYIPGGGKATLKVRGDVVLAGTRRVFVPAGRKRQLPRFRAGLAFGASIGAKGEE